MHCLLFPVDQQIFMKNVQHCCARNDIEQRKENFSLLFTMWKMLFSRIIVKENRVGSKQEKVKLMPQSVRKS